MDMHTPATISAMDGIAPVSRQIWDDKYRLKDAHGTPIDLTIEDTWRRVARRPAAAESDAGAWENEILRGAGGFQVPAGRPDPGRRRDRAAGHPVQLLRHGRHRRRSRPASSAICARRR